MDQSIENYKAAKVSEAIITLSAIEKSIKKENEQKADKREDKKKPWHCMTNAILSQKLSKCWVIQRVAKAYIYG